MTYKCGARALYMSKSTGAFSVGRWRCGATLRCVHCARKRAVKLGLALTAIAAEPKTKFAFLTVTFPPSSKVDMAKVPEARKRVVYYLRKSGVKSYMSVVERHKSGRPHLHFLVVTKSTVRALRDAARKGAYGGFTHAKLVREPARAVSYIAKYCAKGAGRLTASHDVSRVANNSSSDWVLVAIQREAQSDADFDAYVASLVDSISDASIM